VALMAGEFSAELPPQPDRGPGRETVVVRFADGRREELRLHEYDRVYALPGLYEDVVQEQLDCRSPDQVAGMLAAAAARIVWPADRVSVLDVGAGNGVSGEALAARGLQTLVAVDIRESARAAALRDRPGLYEDYLVVDLLGDTGQDEQARRRIHELGPNALACVGAVGPGHLPPAALAAAANLLAPDALVAFTRASSDDDPAWAGVLDPLGTVEQLDWQRYRHRNTVNGEPIFWEARVLRLRREG
jgi:predicted TPR repeat methyltransferase